MLSDDTAFDIAFNAWGNDRAKLRALITNEALQNYLLLEPQIVLTADYDPAITSFMGLNCQIIGAVTQPSRLLRLFELMAETLQQLSSLASLPHTPLEIPNL